MLKFGSPTIIKSLFTSFVKQPLLPAVTKCRPQVLTQSVRCTGFYNRLTGEQLWKGVISVSNAGKKRGRGRGGDRRVKRNLNIGQKMGSGKIRVMWPGLNAPVIKNHEVQRIKEIQTDESQVPEPPAPIRKKKRARVHPLERGWSGRQVRGKRIGPPESTLEETFEGFESIVLENKLVTKMTSVLDRQRTFFTIVATGNGNGLIGVGKSRAIDSKSGIALARKRASRRLITIDLLENHTVNHDFFCEYGRTKVFVFKKPEGFGLKCHRVIIALCKLIGIKNLRAKVEGSMNTTHMIRAFIIGLLRQKTYQQIADDTKMHLVEFSEESQGFPKVLASPEKCLTLKEARENPLSFEEYLFEGKHRYVREKKVPFYMKLPSWTTHLKRTLFHRNHMEVKMNLLCEYGAYKSHLTEVYPECTNHIKKDDAKPAEQ